MVVKKHLLFLLPWSFTSRFYEMKKQKFSCKFYFIFIRLVTFRKSLNIWKVWVFSDFSTSRLNSLIEKVSELTLKLVFVRVCVLDIQWLLLAASLEVFNEIEWLHLFPGLLFSLATHWKSNWSGLIVQNKILFHSVQWRPWYISSVMCCGLDGWKSYFIWIKYHST